MRRSKKSKREGGERKGMRREFRKVPGKGSGGGKGADEGRRMKVHNSILHDLVPY
jgi:hypothetical protein